MDVLVLFAPFAALWFALWLIRPCHPSAGLPNPAQSRMRALKRRTLDAYDDSWQRALSSRHDTGLALAAIGWEVLRFQLSYARVWLSLQTSFSVEHGDRSLDPLRVAAERVLSRTLALHFTLDTA